MSFFTSTPRLVSSLSTTVLSSAVQPPQPVLALVQDLISAKLQLPVSKASMMSPFDTLWHEQIVAVSGSASTPSAGAASAPAGKIRLSGCAGNSISFNAYCSKVS